MGNYKNCVSIYMSNYYIVGICETVRPFNQDNRSTIKNK